MIHDAIFAPVRDALRAKGLPSAIECTYGPPLVPEKVGATRLFMCLDDEAGDAFVGARAVRPNPKLVDVRAVGMKVVIFARSTVQGAHRGNHEDIALAIANMVHVAIHSVVRDAKTTWRVTRAGFRADETTDGWAGRIYELRFQVDTPVSDLTWKGASAPEYTFAGATTAHTVNGAASTSLPNATTRIEE